MNKFGLHKRMLLAVVIVITIVTISLDLAGIYIIRNYMLDRFESRITFLAKYLALNSEVGVLIRDRKGLNSLAINLLGEEEVALVIILDSDGNVLAHQARDIPGKLHEVETLVTLNKRDDENLLFKNYNNAPFGTLAIRGVESIGKVKIKYSTRGINKLIKGVTLQFIWISVILACMAAFLFHFIVRSIVTDVTRLATVAKMIGSGDFDLRAEKGTLPETRELGIAFNAMLDSINKNRKAYEKITKEAARQSSLAELGKFSLSVAHEVKNPLAIIKSSFEFLKKEFQIPEKNTMSCYIIDEIKRLNNLIEDFLLFAKPSKINFINLSTNQFLGDLEKRYTILFNDKIIVFEWQLIDNPVSIRADANLLIQVFDNIIKNAVEVSPEEKEILIRSYSENYMWFCEIKDNGPGIESGMENEIFKPFFTTKSKGTGLGLSLAHQIIKAHNGLLYVENNKERGAVFTLSIPIV